MTPEDLHRILATADGGSSILARALAINPDLLLLDEPFSALDPATRHELQVWLRRAAVDQGLTTSRNPDDLEAFSAKVVEEAAEGKHEGQHA